MRERGKMGSGEVRHLYVVAKAGAVLGWIIRAEDFEMGTLAERGLHGGLDQMARARCRLAGAPLRVGAGDVEIPERYVAQVMGAACVFEHPFGHELGAPVGRNRVQRGVLTHRVGARIAVNRGRRGEDDVTNPAANGRFDEVARFHRVAEIVAERIGHGFGYHDLRGEVRDRVDGVLGDEAQHKRGIARIPANENCAVGDGGSKARREIVEDDYFFTGIEELKHHMAADVAGAAGHQNGHCSSPTLTIGAVAPQGSYRKGTLS